MRAVIERADPTLADEAAGVLLQGVLPAIAAGERERFGRWVGEFGRLNGAWYADEQGGVYRPPAGELIEDLRASGAMSGVGQSSWGPTVYGVTDVEHAGAAREAAETALDRVGVAGEVCIVAPRNTGALVD